MTPRRKTDRPPRALGYARVSTQQQADSGLSLEHQQGKIRAAAALHDYALQDVIVDVGESAATLDRPGIQRVLAQVDARAVDVVLVLKLDRLTRSVRDLADLIDRLRRGKVALVSVQENIDTGSAAGRMVVNLLATVSQWEREAIGERTAAALHRKRARGERYSGRAPYGYRLSQDGQRLEAAPAERQQLETAQDCRAAGSSWRQTADELNRLGYRQRNGKAWSMWNVRRVITTAERRADA